MNLSLRIHTLPKNAPLPVEQALSIGNFDGVHRGHQRLLQRMKDSEYPRAVLTFNPLPREFFQGRDAPIRLTGLREKTHALFASGIHRLYLGRFDAHWASLSAEDFVREILCRRLHARAIYVGHDFRFGNDRHGDTELLQRLGRQWGFTVHEEPPFCLGGERVSSTGIRQALEAGDLARARNWLGRPYSVCGRVRRGDQLGRQLGFPTANVPLKNRPLPLRGIFAGRLRCAQGEWIAAISVGIRPTVAGRDLVLEAHCLDANDPNLYGQLVEVELHQKLHDERKYPNLDILQAAIADDVRAVRSYFSQPIVI